MIKIRELRFLRGAQVVLDGISMTVAQGEIVSIIGPSGCGKTTLLKCLAGLERPTSGSILLDLDGPGGDPEVDLAVLSEADLNEVRREVGMVFQYAALFDSLSVRENIAFPMYRFRPDMREAEIDDEVARLLGLVGLDHTTTPRKMPAELSGGMRKRVGLARALALQPRVILYDEPSSGLDPISAASIDKLIVGMRDQVGVTSVVVSHHVPNVLRTSDRVAMLHGGQLITVSTPAELSASEDPRVRQFITGSSDGPLTDIE
ncbi:MAG: ATP-binding cassette domain-containing protein [Armatimonadetes bacterium]|nr:ATP-binding cassette domain-containing protein [Armatimonadota bacterium]